MIVLSVGSDDISECEAESGESLEEKRKIKYTLREVASKFNSSPKEAIKMMVDLQIIPSIDKVDAIAHQLRKCSALLNKRVFGEYLAKPENYGLVQSLMTDYNFNGMRIDEALRLVMESFRLPGEAQQIERIMDAFAQIYFKTSEKTDLFVDQDAVYVLSYSIIMLNTDQHNKQVRNRMKLEEFIKNNRGINGGANFPAEFLTAIYEDIRMKEIIVPEEHEGELAFSYQWNEVLKRNKIQIYSGAISSSHYAEYISSLIWDPIFDCSLKGIDDFIYI